jgi:hypothetical protein
VNHTKFKYLHSMGGVFRLNNNTWSDWVGSISDDRNLVCYKWEAVPISDLFILDSRLANKTRVVREALDLYLNKPACTHLEVSNSTPMGAISRLAPVYGCLSKVQGQVWLVDGPDSEDKCMLSWALLKGANKQSVG